MNTKKSNASVSKREKALRLAIEAVAAYKKDGGLPADFEKKLIKSATIIESYLSSGELPS